MAEVHETDQIVPFVREYTPCGECAGWEEQYRSVAPAGPGRPDEWVFEGVEVQGRRNHHHKCSRHPRNEKEADHGNQE